MSFLNNLVEQFTHQGQGNQQQQGGYGQQQGGYGQQQGGYGQQQGGYGQQQGGYGQQQYQQQGGNQGRPQPPHPWIAEWDNSQDRWVFVNRETGQRQHEFPSQGGYGQESRGYGQQQNYGSQPQEQKSHGGRNVALGAAAGLAGGALLMHEGHKVEEDWDQDKYRVENDFNRADNYVDRKAYDGVQDVENFPDNAARWTGEKVQEVEDIPQDVDRKWDNLKDDVEDVPDDIAYGVGDAVGGVERFGDNIDNSYDSGRNQQRYDDDDDNGRW